MNQYDYGKLEQFCKNENEHRLVGALKENPNMTASNLAYTIGVHERTTRKILQRLKDRAGIKGYSPEHDLEHIVPMSQNVTGVSSLYKTDGADGKPLLQWVKTSKDREEVTKIVQEVVESLKEDIPKPDFGDIEKSTVQNGLLNLHVLSDYHLSMFAWGEENHDEDWDTDKAEKVLLDWFKTSLTLAPEAEEGILLNLGDFFTSDSVAPVTPTHGHLLDVDKRFQYTIRIAIRVFRQIVDMMRLKYKKVKIYHVSGNHDITSGMWLREVFDAFYENAPDVEVDASPDMYYAHQHGDVSLFFHHGHRRNMKNISDVFTAKFREIYGNTKHSYAHLGHRHSIDVKETGSMVIEQHRTLAPADAHASGGGWVSGRSSYVITYSDKYGEISRVNIPIGLVYDIFE